MPTPNIGLPTVPQGTTNISQAFNDAMQLLDALNPLAVQNRTTAVPPVTVAGDHGKRWLVASGASGAWAGKVGQVALCVGPELWRFIPPRAGMRAWSEADAAFYHYNGSAWVAS